MLLGNTQINVADLRIQVHELNKVDPITGINNFQKQFEVTNLLSDNNIINDTTHEWAIYNKLS